MMLRITVKKKLFTCLVIFIIMMMSVYQYCENHPDKCVYYEKQIPRISLTISHLSANNSKLSAHEKWIPTQRMTTPKIDTLKDLLVQDNRSYARSETSNENKQLYRIERVDFDEVMKEEQEREESKKGHEQLQEDGISLSLKQLDKEILKNESLSVKNEKKSTLPALTNLYREPTMGRFERVDKTILDPGSMSKKELNDYFDRASNGSSVFMYSFVGLNETSSSDLKSIHVSQKSSENGTELLPKALKNIKYRISGPRKAAPKSSDAHEYQDNSTTRRINKPNGTVFMGRTNVTEKGTEKNKEGSRSSNRSNIQTGTESDKFEGDATQSTINITNSTVLTKINGKDTNGLTEVLKKDVLPVHEDDFDDESGNYVKFTKSYDNKWGNDTIGTSDIGDTDGTNDISYSSNTDGTNYVNEQSDIGVMSDTKGMIETSDMRSTDGMNDTRDTNDPREEKIEKELGLVDSYEETGLIQNSSAEISEIKRQTDDNSEEEANYDRAEDVDSGTQANKGERSLDEDASGNNADINSSAGDDISDTYSDYDTEPNEVSSGSMSMDDYNDEEDATPSYVDNNGMTDGKTNEAEVVITKKPLDNVSDQTVGSKIRNDDAVNRYHDKFDNKVGVREEEIAQNGVVNSAEKAQNAVYSLGSNYNQTAFRGIRYNTKERRNVFINTRHGNGDLGAHMQTIQTKLSDYEEHENPGLREIKKLVKPIENQTSITGNMAKDQSKFYSHKEGEMVAKTKDLYKTRTSKINPDEESGSSDDKNKFEEERTQDDGSGSRNKEPDAEQSRNIDVQFEYRKRKNLRKGRWKRKRSSRARKKTKFKGKSRRNGLMFFKKFSCSPLSPKILLYNRIFKTGSTTLNRYLMENGKRNNFKVRIGTTEDWYKTGDEYPFPREIEHFARKYSKKRFFSAHFFFRNNLDIEKSYTYINQVRDPLERVISHYYYMRQTTDRPKQRIMEMITSGQINETLDDCLAKQHRGCESNVMTHFFCGKAPYCETGSPKAIKTAKYNMLHYYAAIGLLDRLDEYVEILKLRLPRFFHSMTQDLTWEKETINKRNATDISQETLEKIKTANTADYEIYEYAKELFQKQLEACRTKILSKD